MRASNHYMAQAHKNRIATEPFAVYVQELQEFSTSCRLPFGSAGDLHGLCTTLPASRRVREDLTSLIRSFAYRENFQVSNSDLLDVVVRAWGGEKPLGEQGLTEVEQEELRALVDTCMKPRRLPETAEAKAEEPDEAAQMPTDGDTVSSAVDPSSRRIRTRMSGAMEKRESGSTRVAATYDITNDSEAPLLTGSSAAAESNVSVAPAQVQAEPRDEGVLRPDPAKHFDFRGRSNEALDSMGPWSDGSTLHLALQEFARRRVTALEKELSQRELTRSEARRLNADKLAMKEFLRKGTGPR